MSAAQQRTSPEERGQQIAVPQVVPRFPRRRPPMPALSMTDAEPEVFTPTQRLIRRKTETLTVNYRDATMEEDVRYHTYAMYRHGKKKIVSRSIGYNERGDFVLQRCEEAELIGANRARRAVVQVEGAVCLDPKAKTAISDDEGNLLREEKKYPGVKCPKNRRVRNRLMNDHFASAAAHPLREAAIAKGQGRVDQDVAAAATGGTGSNSQTPVFGPIPVSLQRLLDIEDDEQDKLFAKLDLGPSQASAVPSTTDVNSAQWRFQQLPTKMRSEVRHALLSTDFMPGFVRDIEEKCVSLIRSAPGGPSQAAAAAAAPAAANDFTVACRDGYGRLMCHAVALFYHLISKSENDPTSGARVTRVSLAKRRPVLPSSTLCDLVLGGGGVSPPGSPQVPLASVHHLDATVGSKYSPGMSSSAKTSPVPASGGTDGEDEHEGAAPRLRFKRPRIATFSPLKL